MFTSMGQNTQGRRSRSGSVIPPLCATSADVAHCRGHYPKHTINTMYMPKSTYFIVANTYNENDDLSVVFLMDITKHGGAIFTADRGKAKKYSTKQSAVSMLIEGLETGEWERSTLTEQGEDTDALNCFGVIRELKDKKYLVAGSTDIAPQSARTTKTQERV